MRGWTSVLGAACALAVAAFPGIGAAAPDQSRAAVVAAYNGCGQQLFQIFAQKPGNIVLSPYSIGTAMAMTLAGARGATAAEMAKVLGLQLPANDVNAANADLLASLNAAASTNFQLRVANAMMLTRPAATISEQYVALLQRQYAAEVFHGADLAAVNGWVKAKTDGKIDSILDRLDPATALVLIDAIYFKAPWEKAFDAKATQDETFHFVNGAAAVPMMHFWGDFALVQRPGYRAIRIPYADSRLSMVVILPDGDLSGVVQRFDGQELQALREALRVVPQLVDLSLPRFKADFEASLVEPFTAMGMHRAFEPNADFSGMTGQPPAQSPMALDQIVHHAVIDVAEQGTEAAASTAVSVVATAVAPQKSETFRVDRPFLFVIVDGMTGAVLFEGRIVDPR